MGRSDKWALADGVIKDLFSRHGGYHNKWVRIAGELSAMFPNFTFTADQVRQEYKEKITGGHETEVVIPEKRVEIIKREPDDYEALHKVIKQQDKEIAKLRANEENIIRAMSAQISKIRPESWNIQVPPRTTRRHESEMHEYWSDVHDGAEIKFRDTMGLSTYSPEIMERRFDLLTDKTCAYREDDHKIHGLNKLVIGALGDALEGTNVYQGQAFSLVLNELEQWRHSAEVWSRNIIKLCKVFPEVEMFCVGGNHGFGSTKKGNSPQFRADDFLYYHLMAMLQNVPNLKIYISDCPRMVVQHGSKIFVYSHGNESVSWMGIPFYGLKRTVQRLPGLTGVIQDYYVCGHFHDASSVSDGEIIINGCFPGGSDLSINKMNITSRPSQKMVYFDPKENGHGIFHMNNIYLADKPRLTPDERGIFTPHNSLAFALAERDDFAELQVGEGL